MFTLTEQIYSRMITSLLKQELKSLSCSVVGGGGVSNLIICLVVPFPSKFEKSTLYPNFQPYMGSKLRFTVEELETRIYFFDSFDVSFPLKSNEKHTISKFLTFYPKYLIFLMRIKARKSLGPKGYTTVFSVL